MAKIPQTRGVTKNDIPYVKFEGGSKIAMVWAGGPGNALPAGWLFDSLTRPLHPLLDEYTVIFLSRRSGLTDGYSTKDFAGDYAELIKNEYGGHVDLIYGLSYGGIVAQHFAADHYDLCDHLVIGAAAYKVHETEVMVDYRYAELVHQNKVRQALASMASALYSNKLMVAIMRPILWLLAPTMLGKSVVTETYRNDILIEAKAEVAHDGSESLKRITKPTLIQGGELDKYFPLEFLQKTQELIPNGNGKLIIYPGHGHNILELEKPILDVLEWIAELESN
ncbi:MAG: alpha/beta hydrolase [Chloroflexota bacterium]